jgi:hypothetical protein
MYTEKAERGKDEFIKTLENIDAFVIPTKARNPCDKGVYLSLMYFFYQMLKGSFIG